MPSPVSGRRLGEYLLVRRIAVGGMAEVFEARRGDEPAPLVLKILLPQFKADPELIKMFEDEARLTRTLNHPNLVRVLDYGEVAGERFMVMEHVDGPTLSQLLKHLSRSERTMSSSLALTLAGNLLQGLHYIHERADETGRSLEIVHRDVTPGNVLLSRSGEVKLGDFGIARHKLRSERTRTGVIKGTVQYMAPEQITGVDIDQRTDIYGVGLIFFEMLTGQPYIQGEREVEMLTLAQDPPWRPPSAVGIDLDAELDQLLRPALARFPEERYPNAQSFLGALDQARAKIGATTEEEALGVLQELVAEVARSNEELVCGPTISTPLTPVLANEAASPADVAEGDHRGGQGEDNGIGPVEAPAGGAAARSAGGRRWLLIIPGALVALAGWFALRPGSALVGEAQLDAGRVDAPLAAARDRGLDRTTDLPISLDQAPKPVSSPQVRPRVRPRTPPKQRADAAVQRPDLRAESSGALHKMRLDRALTALAGRGILVEDLTSGLREKVRVARQRVRKDPAAPALAQELQQLELALGAVQVDRGLVELKLKRVDQQLARAKQRGLKVQPLRDRSSVALQAFMDGRYSAANRHLNAIISALMRQGRP